MEVAIKDIFSTLYLYQNQMTAGQLNFVDGCKKEFKRYKQLSDKQLAVLTDIKKHLLVNKAEQRYSYR